MTMKSKVLGVLPFGEKVGEFKRLSVKNRDWAARAQSLERVSA